jgi:rhodanese-related sulfurtransferase
MAHVPPRRDVIHGNTVALVQIRQRDCLDPKVKTEVNMFFNFNRCQNIGPEELNEKIQEGEDFLLLDVRTPRENAVQAIPGSYLVPLQELGFRINELPKNKEIVVYCRVGDRSAYACSHLASLGYQIKNLEGGIVLWNMAGNASLAKV